MIDYKHDLGKNKSVAIVFPIKDYPIEINNLLKSVSTYHTKVLYISLNRLYIPLKKKMKQDGIDVSKFVYVDCVTKTAIAQPEEFEDCVYVQSPNSLTETSIAITKMIQKKNPEVILFDSLSTLLIYENNMTVSQFVHSLTNKLTAFGVNSIFTLLDGEKEKMLIQDLNLLLDKVITVSPDK